LRKLALTHRKDTDEPEIQATDAQRITALGRLEKEIESDAMQGLFTTLKVPSNSLIKKANGAVKDAVVSRVKPDLKTKIGNTIVSVYLAKDMSVDDPYVIIESSKSETSVIVIVNLSHPHWFQLTNEESILNFIRHCTYDGVAESKAFFVRGTIEPDTVKLIKDKLLRIPMTLGSRFDQG